MKEWESDLPERGRIDSWVLEQNISTYIDVIKFEPPRIESDKNTQSWMMTNSTNINQLTRHTIRLKGVENAKTVEEIINILNFHDFSEIAERLRYLQKVVEEDEDNENIKLQSLQNFGMFTLHSQLPSPQIGVTLKGLVQAVWRLPHFGSLVINFQKSSDVTFSVLYNQRTQEGRRRKISGEMPLDRVMVCISDFVRELESA